MRVRIWFQFCSTVTTFENVIASYQKGDLFCVRTKATEVYKFPIANIFRIIEDNFETTLQETKD